MRFKFVLLFLCFSSVVFAECRYKMVEQNGTYFAVKKVIGDLPSEKQKIKNELKVGINNVEVVSKQEQGLNENSKKDTRVRVRFKSKNKQQVSDFVNKFCS